MEAQHELGFNPYPTGKTKNASRAIPTNHIAAFEADSESGFICMSISSGRNYQYGSSENAPSMRDISPFISLGEGALVGKAGSFVKLCNCLRPCPQHVLALI